MIRRRISTPVTVVLAVLFIALLPTGAGAWAEPGPIPADTDWLFEEDAPDPADRDPLEPMNRGIFTFNEFVYAWLLDPVATAYEFVVPDPGRRAVRRFFANLGEPVTFVNDLLQLEPKRAGKTGARFLINSTAGVVGIFDPAGAWGIDGHTSDFGETLGVYRVGSGPYLIIPVMGPSTLRDALGEIVDGVLRPDTWLLTPASQLIIVASGGIATYEGEREQIEALRATSVDFYAALRSAYLMDRDARIQARIRGDEDGSTSDAFEEASASGDDAAETETDLDEDAAESDDGEAGAESGIDGEKSEDGDDAAEAEGDPEEGAAGDRDGDAVPESGDDEEAESDDDVRRSGIGDLLLERGQQGLESVALHH